jgi:hypothetical protein
MASKRLIRRVVAERASRPLLARADERASKAALLRDGRTMRVS